MSEGVPEGSSVLIPRLVCRDIATEAAFLVDALDAVRVQDRPAPDGQIAHALLTIGPQMIMIEREWPVLPSRAPTMDGSSPVVLFVYVEDVDGTVARATALGARVLVPAQNQFWGDRTAWIVDPSGHVWTIATRIEQTTEEERKTRWSEIVARRQED
jgi:PhnB protein